MRRTMKTLLKVTEYLSQRFIPRPPRRSIFEHSKILPPNLLLLPMKHKVTRHWRNWYLHTIWQISSLFLRRRTLTSYQSANGGIMLLNSYLMQNRSKGNAFHFPYQSRRNWTFSSRNILKLVGSDLQNPHLHPPSFLSRRRMENCVQFKTITN